MIKAISTLYLFSFLLICGVLSENKLVVGFGMAGCYGLGMVAFYFINQHAKQICKGGNNE